MLPLVLRPTTYLREYLHPLADYKSLNLNVMQHLSHITQARQAHRDGHRHAAQVRARLYARVESCHLVLMLKEAQLLYANGQAMLAKERDAAAATAASAAAAAAGVANGGEANSSLQTSAAANIVVHFQLLAQQVQQDPVLGHSHRLSVGQVRDDVEPSSEAVSRIGEQPVLIDALLCI